MTNETETQVTPETTTETKTLESPDLSFSEYKTLRRGGTVKREAQASAPEANTSEQKHVATESETAAKEEGKGETEVERESGELDTAGKENEPVDGKKTKKGGIQKRFDKMTAEKAALAQELEYWKQTALKGKEANPEAKTPEAPKAKADEGKPDPNSYATHQEWVEAVADWKADQKLKQLEEKQAKERVQSEQQKVVQTYLDRKAAFSEKTPDFDEVVHEVDDIPVSLTVQNIILKAENGPQLAYELAKNREEYARICKLPPMEAALEMGALKAKLLAKSSPSTEAKKLTNAPKPLEPVGSGKGATPKKSLDDPELSYKEYVKLRRQGKTA